MEKLKIEYQADRLKIAAAIVRRFAGGRYPIQKVPKGTYRTSILHNNRIFKIPL
jgi:hypothetical protein